MSKHLRHRLKGIPLAAGVLIACTGSIRAEVQWGPVFSDHMVLQRDATLPLWGTADPNENVRIRAGESETQTQADGQGHWSVALKPMKASDQPMDVSASGSNTAVLHDVLIGDVWVCSGQSNMEFQLGGGSFGFGGASNAAEAIPHATNPNIRLLIISKKVSYEPLKTARGQWTQCAPATAARFSAVGYFFGAAIQADQHVPIGLIGTYWGGQTSQTFTSMDKLKSDPKFAPLVEDFEKRKSELSSSQQKYEAETLPAWQKKDEQWKLDRAAFQKARSAGQTPPALPREPRKPESPVDYPAVPSVLFNGMIEPIIPLAIKGAIWYQGESNAGDPVLYQSLFPALITDWREQWHQGDFPFIWVQLANFHADAKTTAEQQVQSSSGWAGLREAQSMTLKLPNTGQAVIVDIGNGGNIHPTDKVDVGQRLALAARHVAYGEDLVYSGPTFDQLRIDGDHAAVSFKNVGEGLAIGVSPIAGNAKPQSELQGFSIAGADRRFYPADGKIDGDQVILHSDHVTAPVAVRYGWADDPNVNLYNKNGLPASPFRTDSFH